MMLLRSLSSLLVEIAIAALMLWYEACFAQPHDSISIAWDAKPRTIDPRYATDANSQYLEDLTSCSLFTFNPEGELSEELVLSYIWQNPRELLITIKPNIHFSDGSLVDAHAVATLYNYLRTEDSLSPRHAAFTNIKDIEVPDPLHIVFKLNEADAAFLSNLVVGILPPGASKLPRPFTLEDHPASCGLYTIASSKPAEIVLQQNPHYNLSSPALIKTIVIKIIKDETTAYAKLKNGEIDLVQGLISRDKISVLASLPHIAVNKRSGLNASYLAFNMRDPLLSKRKLRQAIAYAIERESIIKYILKDFATLASQMFPPGHKYYAQDIPMYNYDLSKARTLVAELNSEMKRSDPTMSFTYSTTTNITRIAIARALGAQLAKIGIKLKIEVSDWSRFKQNVEKGNSQMWTLSWIGFKDPDILNFAFASKSFPPNGGNRGFFSNSLLDQLLDKGKISTNFKERKKYYDAGQKIIAEEEPYIFLWHEDLYVAHNTSLQDFVIFADGRYRALATAHFK